MALCVARKTARSRLRVKSDLKQNFNKFVSCVMHITRPALKSAEAPLEAPKSERPSGGASRSAPEPSFLASESALLPNPVNSRPSGGRRTPVAASSAWQPPAQRPSIDEASTFVRPSGGASRTSSVVYAMNIALDAGSGDGSDGGAPGSEAGSRGAPAWFSNPGNFAVMMLGYLALCGGALALHTGLTQRPAQAAALPAAAAVCGQYQRS